MHPPTRSSSYNLYRGTASGGEGATPIATTTATTYTDKGLSTTPIYFYEIRTSEFSVTAK